MSTKDYSNAQESAVCNFLGWNLVAASGAATCSAGDIISDRFLGECKTHERKGSKVTFRQDVWLKICDEAMVFGRLPVLIADDGSQDVNRTYCLINSPSVIDHIPVSDFNIRKYNVNYRKHLSFDPDKLYSKFKGKYNVIYLVPWFNGNVLLTKLETFKELIQYL